MEVDEGLVTAQAQAMNMAAQLGESIHQQQLALLNFYLDCVKASEMIL